MVSTGSWAVGSMTEEQVSMSLPERYGGLCPRPSETNTVKASSSSQEHKKLNHFCFKATKKQSK